MKKAKQIIISGIAYFSDNEIKENLQRISDLLQVFFEDETEKTAIEWQYNELSLLIAVKVLLMHEIRKIEKTKKMSSEEIAKINCLQMVVKILNKVKTLKGLCLF